MAASLQITTLARVKAAAGQTTVYNDARISEVIEAVSEFAESYLSRHLLISRRTAEEYEVRRGQPLIWLRGMPIGAVYSVKYATRRRFTDATILDADEYDVHAQEGQLELLIQLTGNPGWICVDYEGGMAVDTASFVASYGAIAEAATMEVVNRLNRSTSPEGSQKAMGTELVQTDPLNTLQTLKDALSQRRRFAA